MSEQTVKFYHGRRYTHKRGLSFLATVDEDITEGVRTRIMLCIHNQFKSFHCRVFVSFGEYYIWSRY